MADAVVHIGPFHQPQARPLIRRFYERCGLEVVGPGRIQTGDIKNFDTLEGLVDNMHGRAETYHVVVAHGNRTEGMLVPFVPESPKAFNATGQIIDKVAALVQSRSSSAGTPGAPTALGSPAPGAPDPVVDELAANMGVHAAVVLRLVGKLAAIRPAILELRGCHLAEATDLSLLRGYKAAFNAVSVSGPDGRMFYVTCQPHRPGASQTMASLASVTPGGGTRRRVFQGNTAALTQAGTLIFDVRDIDGHTQVDTEAFMDAPAGAAAWAPAIDGAWKGPVAEGFVTQVIWQNSANTYHTPFDVSYRDHIKRV
jgi:hypothetical protein